MLPGEHDEFSFPRYFAWHEEADRDKNIGFCERMSQILKLYDTPEAL
ncbi:MAG: hypothetical protein Q4C96_01350 [Planctomycetia bacterium]|nr:hypothetical protein [Planctomycetia bacterium]